MCVITVPLLAHVKSECQTSSIRRRVAALIHPGLRSDAVTLAHLVSPSPTPLLTHYDLATGERIELSGTSTANWVAKTANFLSDELDAGPGTRIRVGLPPHWLRWVWLLSSWAAGVTVTDHDADIGLSGPDLVADEDVRLAASLRPLGGRFVTTPDGFLDIAAEVPSQPDVFMALTPVTLATAALDLDGVVQTHGDLIDAVTPDPRRLIVTEASVAEDARSLVAACRGGGSLVLVVNATGPDDLARVAEQERAVWNR